MRSNLCNSIYNFIKFLFFPFNKIMKSVPIYRSRDNQKEEEKKNPNLKIQQVKSLTKPASALITSAKPVEFKIYDKDINITEVYNYSGPPGPRGIKGDTGATGATGPTGLKGDTGPAGPTGLKGDTGPAGENGLKGDTGPAGEIGLKGDTGNVGPTGPPGPPGSATNNSSGNSYKTFDSDYTCSKDDKFLNYIGTESKTITLIKLDSNDLGKTIWIMNSSNVLLNIGGGLAFSLRNDPLIRVPANCFVQLLYVGDKYLLLAH